MLKINMFNLNKYNFNRASNVFFILIISVLIIILYINLKYFSIHRRVEIKNRSITIENIFSDNDDNNKNIASTSVSIKNIVSGSTYSSTSTLSTSTLVENKISILAYHQVRNNTKWDSFLIRELLITPPEIFEKDMKYLSDNGYKSIGLDELIYAINNNKVLNSKSVVITFDDGYRDQYINALPILEKYNIKATFFIYTNAIDKFPIAMTWDQVIDLSNRGMTIGAHTRSHPNLKKIKDENKLVNEILGSKLLLQEKIGKPVNFFAYPYGLYSSSTVQEVINVGYLGAVADTGGKVHTKKDVYTLKRFNMGNEYIEMQGVMKW